MWLAVIHCARIAPPRAHDARDALRHHGNVLDQNARVDGEIVNALLRLLFDDLEVEIDVQVFDASSRGSERLVQRHGPDGHR